QTEQYWVEDFQLDQQDIEHLFNVLLERETPLSADEMALVLVRYRVQQEEERLANATAPGHIYKPERDYEVGDAITLPQFNQARGKVVGKRAGQNPDDGQFSVITVEVEGGQQYDIAAALESEHSLNLLEEELVEEEEDLLSPEELFIEYGGYVADEISERLATHDDLVRLAGRWFPRSLLVNINVG